MRKSENTIARLLLQSNAIKLNATNPFQWASGWKSPIYCDNRKTLSYPAIRTAIKTHFVEIIKNSYPQVECIAGVATGAISWGALVADLMELPFVYVRSSQKQHGLGNQIEGDVINNQKVVVLEDLVSTGGSSLKAVKALRENGCNVLGMIAIFTYGFEASENAFKHANCKLVALSNYETLIQIAAETGYVQKKDIKMLNNWRKNPENWKKK